MKQKRDRDGEGEKEKKEKEKEKEKEREKAVSYLASQCPIAILTKDLLSALEQAGYYLILRDIYLKVKDYDRSIAAHLAGAEDRASIFPFLDALVQNDCSEKSRKVILSHFDVLSAIDPSLFAHLLTSHFFDERHKEGEEEERERGGEREKGERGVKGSFGRALRGQPKVFYYFLSFAASDRAMRTRLSDEEGDLLIKYMCEYEPHKVKDHLVKSDNYRTLESLKCVTEYHLYEAQSYLLEKLGDCPGALNALLTLFSQKTHSLFSLLRPSALPDGRERERARLLEETEEVVSASRSLCVRSSQRENMGRKEMESLWGKLIEELSRYLRSLRGLFSKKGDLSSSPEFQRYV